MATPKPAPEDTAALVDHFRNLSFEGKKTVLTELRTIIQEEAQKERADLLARLAELDALTGQPDASAHQHAGEREGKARGPVDKVYWSRRNPERGWSGRGSQPQWFREEMLTFGLTREDMKEKRKFPQYQKGQADEYETPPT